MTNYELTNEEKNRRKNVSAHTRKMVMSQLRIDDQDETSLMTDYRDYYLQISFSELHPLMVFCVAKGMKTPSTAKQRKLVNELNLKSILGSHAINDEVGCYSYRATHWLDKEIDPVVLCQDNGHIKPLLFGKISKMHKVVAFIPRFA